MTQRVVITGMGAVTPIGIGKEEYWQNLLKGTSGVKPLVFPTMDMDLYRTKIAASLDSFDPAAFFPINKNTKYLGRTSQVALAATKLAFEDGGFELVQDKKKTSIAGIDPDKINSCIPHEDNPP